MSQIAMGHSEGGHGHAHHHGHGHHGHGGDPLDRANVTMPDGWGRALAYVLIVIGLVALAATAAYSFIEKGELAPKQATASYLVGFMVALGLMLGTLGIVMIWHLVKAGWSTTLRRLAENVCAIMPIGFVLVAPVIAFAPNIYKWMKHDPAHHDELLEHKAPYLSPTFFYVRLGVYFVVWTILALRLAGLSRKQDQTGDKWLSNKMSVTSAWGILAFALTVAFAGFDLIKSLDYHWFSTMFGVYFFAGNMIASLSLIVVLMTLARSAGRLRGVVTEEHYHDMGKLMLGFTVFWAYIAFSQYFLIWYANIPEETAWFLVRYREGWQTLGILLIVGHFVAPFLILLFRKTKRTPALLTAVALWLLVMHCVDIFWLVRPVVNTQGPMALTWVDLTGLIGPVCLLLGLVVLKMGRGPLIPVADPRLPEALHHKNYV